VIYRSGMLSPGSIFTFIGWALVVYPLVYIVLLQIPFSFTRNTQFIRWVFLTKIYRRVGLWPPQASAWLADQKRQSPALASVRTRREQIEAENEARTAELRRKYAQR